MDNIMQFVNEENEVIGSGIIDSETNAIVLLSFREQWLNRSFK